MRSIIMRLMDFGRFSLILLVKELDFEITDHSGFTVTKIIENQCRPRYQQIQVLGAPGHAELLY